jgi:hypothetical protein
MRCERVGAGSKEKGNKGNDTKGQDLAVSDERKGSQQGSES